MSVRNKIIDLNNHLFAQLERLNDETLSTEQMNQECEKAKQMSNIAKNIVENNKVAVTMLQLLDKQGYDISSNTRQLGIETTEK
jgi:hypothetical protein